MQDVLIQADEFGRYDLAIENGDFAQAPGFESAILVSLFSDARAPASVVAEPRNRRGWIGNILNADTGRELGGLLWTYDQARLVPGTLNGLRRAVEGSLAWMVEDGVATQVDVTVDQISNRVVQIGITITAIDNSVGQYAVLWRATDLSRAS